MPAVARNGLESEGPSFGAQAGFLALVETDRIDGKVTVVERRVLACGHQVEDNARQFVASRGDCFRSGLGRNVSMTMRF